MPAIRRAQVQVNPAGLEPREPSFPPPAKREAEKKAERTGTATSSKETKTEVPGPPARPLKSNKGPTPPEQPYPTPPAPPQRSKPIPAPPTRPDPSPKSAVPNPPDHPPPNHKRPRKDQQVPQPLKSQ